jgi:hypothetical protein
MMTTRHQINRKWQAAQQQQVVVVMAAVMSAKELFVLSLLPQRGARYSVSQKIFNYSGIFLF